MIPKVVSCNRFVELEKEVAISLALFIKKVLLGKCTGINFIDSIPLRVCKNKRIHIHKTFKGIAQRGKCFMDWFFRLMNECHYNGTYQIITLPAPNEVNILKVVGKDGSITVHKLM